MCRLLSWRTPRPVCPEELLGADRDSLANLTRIHCDGWGINHVVADAQTGALYAGGGGDWLGGRVGVAAAAFVLGTFGIGLAAPGQPHVVNHFMAARDAAAIRTGGFIAIGWIAVVLAGMLVVGWSGRLLASAPADAEAVLYAAAGAWL